MSRKEKIKVHTQKCTCLTSGREPASLTELDTKVPQLLAPFIREPFLKAQGMRRIREEKAEEKEERGQGRRDKWLRYIT